MNNSLQIMSLKKINDLKTENNIKILNPLSNELNILRRTLLLIVYKILTIIIEEFRFKVI